MYQRSTLTRLCFAATCVASGRPCALSRQSSLAHSLTRAAPLLSPPIESNRIESSRVPARRRRRPDAPRSPRVPRRRTHRTGTPLRASRKNNHHAPSSSVTPSARSLARATRNHRSRPFVDPSESARAREEDAGISSLSLSRATVDARDATHRPPHKKPPHPARDTPRTSASRVPSRRVLRAPRDDVDRRVC